MNVNNYYEELRRVLLNNDFDDIIDADETKKLLKTALLTNRHIILVGPPGCGKTTLAKNVAKLLPKLELNDCPYHCDPKNPVCPECLEKRKKGIKIKTRIFKGEERFVRVQGSPDLTVEDLIGDLDPVKALKFGPSSIQAFTPGKIFKANYGVLFFDEINRAPERIQNALLQVLQEHKITLSGFDVEVPTNFILIATMNPEDTSTEPLSDVFIDRFDLIPMDYPSTLKEEVRIVKEKGEKLIDFPNKLLVMIVLFIRELRRSDKLEKKPSVRASIGLYERSQAHALLMGRKRVSLDDVKAVLNSVIAHRIRFKPSYKFIIKKEDFIREEFNKILSYEDKELKELMGGSL